MNDFKVGENASTTHTDRDNETVWAREQKEKIPRKNISKGRRYARSNSAHWSRELGTFRRATSMNREWLYFL